MNSGFSKEAIVCPCRTACPGMTSRLWILPPIVSERVAVCWGGTIIIPLNVGLLATLVALVTTSGVVVVSVAEPLAVITVVSFPSSGAEGEDGFSEHPASRNKEVHRQYNIFLFMAMYGFEDYSV